MALYQWGTVPGALLDANGILLLPAGGALAVGPSPALSGAIRLSNNQAIQARSTGGTDMLLVKLTSADQVQLGYPVSVTQTGATAAVTVNNAGGTNPQVVRGVDGSVIAKLQLLGGTSALVGTESNHPFALYQNNTERLRLDGSTVRAAQPLEVKPDAGAVATAGDVRVKSGFVVSQRNRGNSANVTAVASDDNDNLEIGGTRGGSRPGDVIVDSTSSLKVMVGGSPIFTVSTAELDSVVPLLSFRETVASPTIRQDTDATASVTGDTLLVQAQDCSGSGSTGGSLHMRPGSGTTSHGTGRLKDGAGADVLTWVSNLVSVPGDTAAVRVGTNPSTDGSSAIGLANNRFISWRNGANSANVTGMYVDTSNVLRLGASGVTARLDGAVLEFGSTVAASGALRLANAAEINWRMNGAGTLQGIRSDTSDRVVVGGTNVLSVRLDTNAGTTVEASRSGATRQLGFFGVTPVSRAPAYTVTNLTTDRSYNANSTTIAELADVVGTLIADLRAYGLVQ
jgi:hypothetical protein